ncbi:MAG: hypothetical protein LAN64_05270 [Acidobacteriia bacterium]|nr:hypothetical protein [Terriglobia bacterium]
MADDIRAIIKKLGLSPNLLDILVNVLVVLKLQQLNIDLLWEAYTSGKPPSDEVTQVRESNRRLAESMEQMVGVMLSKNRGESVRPD